MERLVKKLLVRWGDHYWPPAPAVLDECPGMRPVVRHIIEQDLTRDEDALFRGMKDEIRRKIGISLQETRLSDKLTVRETVALALENEFGLEVCDCAQVSAAMAKIRATDRFFTVFSIWGR